ncbi:MAG TPA: CaiB/BaiF CoA-transferase family protein, partial [Acidimicrobiales bacterium]|nr:CaiB/BaiF CoA-transferase family protein [Acidimicrobiales bacterium]
SGPSCGKALADLGADVVKVEPPEGDLTRTAQPRVDGIPVYFAQQNCGKRCVSIDLQTARGREIVLRLSSLCDVVLENFRPGVMDRLGLGYQQVRAGNPGVVYCSITGYGQLGPAAGRRAYAPVMHAEIGLMEFTARKLEAEVQPEAVSHADLYTGLQATIGILAALVQREHTGRGQHIDVSMAEVMLQATEWTAVELAGGEGGRFHVFGGFNAPVLRLGDGTVVCVPGDPVSTFPAWSRAMGREDLLDDERFATHAARAANRKAMLGLLQGFASGFDHFTEFEAAIGAHRIAVGLVRSLREAATAEWAGSRGALVDAGEGGDPLLLPFSPFRFSEATSGTWGRPAWQGQHNAEVLGELLGMSEDDCAGLEAAGVLARRPPDARGGRGGGPVTR